ncbi:hypothetical protein Y032_0004g1853 [Ancylostoma ceylanicum]|uniref:Uncharacterized protein n=1 Tax=Ancylostoma ceylanicum TaxID=53326 RepID=A0A016VU38_9BILA|nr:hypothetical protein Y032_0004g1853 [Ancylostoma ceylanicum]
MVTDNGKNSNTDLQQFGELCWYIGLRGHHTTPLMLTFSPEWTLSHVNMSSAKNSIVFWILILHLTLLQSNLTTPKYHHLTAQYCCRRKV